MFDPMTDLMDLRSRIQLGVSRARAGGFSHTAHALETMLTALEDDVTAFGDAPGGGSGGARGASGIRR